MKKRTLCFLLSIMILISFATAPTPAQAKAASNNITDRADYLYNITWVAQKDVKGWNDKYTFYKGNTYHAPYGQPVTKGKYIGFGVSVEDFLISTKSADSIFYNEQSTYAGNTSAYYSLDCSAFVSYCWDMSRHTTATIPSCGTSYGNCTSDNIDKIELGDALNSKSIGHVVLVTDITYDNKKVSKVEITEQTPPQLKRTTYTRDKLISKYSQYTIYRYTKRDSVSPAPTPLYSISKSENHCSISDLPVIAHVGDEVSFTVNPDKGYYIDCITLNSTELAQKSGTHTFTMPQEDVAIDVLTSQIIIGDVDRDADINIIDVTMIQRYLASLVQFDGYAELSADTDGDGEVTIVDATYIQRYLSKLITSFPTTGV